MIQITRNIVVATLVGASVFTYGQQSLAYTARPNIIKNYIAETYSGTSPKAGVTQVDMSSASLEPEVTPEPAQPYVQLTDSEKYMLACLIWLEARGESEECQYAVGSVVLNRLVAYQQPSLSSVIYKKNAFTPAKYISKTTPDELQLTIVNNLVTNGPTIPIHVVYFRTKHYHTFSEAERYTKIDSTYFSSDRNLK